MENIWHTPLEEPECDDYDYVLYDFGHRHVEVLLAKSYVDWTQVKRWCYYE